MPAIPTIIDRFHPHRRQEQQKAADAGHLGVLVEAEILNPAQIRPLALLSLVLLVIGCVFFIVLNLFAYTWRTGHTSASINVPTALLWFLINCLAYVLVLPLHELIHGAAFTLWGGKPYYGTRLPLALYCSAKNQIFPRNYYLVIGLAPLVVITVAGIVFTLLAPTLAPYTLFATAGNISGAAGDIWVVAQLLKLPSSVLIEDTETGYRAWELTLASTRDTMRA